MKLHVVYRSVGWENGKPRPRYYSKDLCLLSLLHAVEDHDAPVETIFLNDGEIPAERLALMEAGGEVLQVATPPGRARDGLLKGRGGSGVIRSHLEGMALADSRGWPGEDIVYFVEDDYLHRPESLSKLAQAADRVPGASYFGLYASIDRRRARGFEIDDTLWLAAESTTLTFAARIAALRDDRWLHRFGLFARGAMDLDVCLAYQGHRPHRWNRMIGSLFGKGPDAPLPPAERLKMLSVQTAVNLLAVKQGFDPRLLIAPASALATHMETPHLAPGFDWESLARETAARAARDGRPAPAV